MVQGSSPDRIQVDALNAPITPTAGLQPLAKERLDTDELIQVPTPTLQLFSRIGHRKEPVCVQALRSQSAIERFDECVVGWLAGP